MTRPIATLLLCLAAVCHGFANGIRLPYQDMDAVSRGYAFAATADTPGAIYYNPAGIAQLKDGTAEAGVNFIRPQNRYQGAGHDVSAKTETFTIPYLFAVEPVSVAGQSVAIGAALYSPFGLSSEWSPTATGFRTLATKNSLVFRRYAVTAATAIVPHVMVGGSIQYDRMNADLNRGIGYVPGDNINFTGRSTARSYNLGALYQPTPQHSFGLQYQSKTEFSVTGVTSYQPLNVGEPSTVSWPFPENYTLSYSYRPVPEWNLEIGYDRTHWSRFGTLVINRAASGPLPLAFNWKDSSYYEFGGTHYWPTGWNWSAGGCWSGNSEPDATFNPSVVDYNRWIWNTGVGYRTGGWSISTLLQYSPRHTRVVNGSLRSPAGESADGSYTASLWTTGLQAELRW